MKAFTPCVLMLAAVGFLQIGISAALAAPQNNILQQQQILNKKEQEQASKRAEKDLQYRVSRPMAKTQQRGQPFGSFFIAGRRKKLCNKAFLFESA